MLATLSFRCHKCFKMSFGLQLFATVNPFMIFATIKRKSEIYCWAEVPLYLPCQREFNHSVPWRNSGWHSNRLCHFALCGNWLLLFHIPVFRLKLFPIVYRRSLSKRENKWLHRPAGPSTLLSHYSSLDVLHWMGCGLASHEEKRHKE